MSKKQYVVKTDFTSKATRKRHYKGDEFIHEDEAVVKDLAGKGLIEEGTVKEKKEHNEASEKKHIKKPGS